MNPAHKSQERAFALQKYLLLHSQHSALQKHLSQITTSLPSSPSHSPCRKRYGSTTSADSSSPSSSFEGECPYLHQQMSGSPSPFPSHLHRSRARTNSLSPTASRPRRPALHQRRSSLPTVIDESIIGEIEQDEEKIKDVNLQIKSTLTELLNCESVKGDRRYRMWVQTRLMDAEKELKVEKTRRGDRRRSEDVGDGDGFTA